VTSLNAGTGSPFPFRASPFRSPLTPRLALLPRQDVIISMTTPPLVVVAAVVHKVLHPRTRVVLWSMDCYPDAAERFGELRAGGLASRVSVHPEVRSALNKRQVDFADQPGGAVLDGRDIGTVIAPLADVKLFVTASAEIRAERRYKEMQGRSLDVDYETILSDIRARDKRDMERADAPLKPAKDAHLLDTGNLTIGAAVQRAIALVDAKIENRPA